MMGDIRPEYIFLGYLTERPAHGYQIYRSFKDSLDSLWHISEIQMYASLKRLEKRGWIALTVTSETPVTRKVHVDGAAASSGITLQGGRRNRNCFVLTPQGLTAFETWLHEPTIASPRFLKLEFLSRLYFALRRDVESAYKLVETQRLALEAELNRLVQQKSSGGRPLQEPLLFDIAVLATDFRIRQIQAALDWLKRLL